MIRRNLVNLLIAAIVYFNLAALILASGFRFSSPWPEVAGPLPNHWVTQRMFQMFSLFGGITRHSVAYSAYGVRESLGSAPAEPTEDMLDLDIYRYFPQTLGEANRRLGLLTYVGDDERLDRGYQRMAETIRRWHNRTHPAEEVAQVFIYQHWWPKSEQGYYHFQDQRHTQLKGHSG